jgi:DNA-binding transcriptional MerR regulator
MELLTIKDVATLLGVQAYRIAYAITAGHVAEPEQRLLNKRLFSDEDVRRLETYFAAKRKRGRDAV